MMSIRIVRIIRVVRVLRVIRLMRFLRPLRLLVHSIYATLKSLVYAVLLLVVIMYSFAVVFAQASTEYKDLIIAPMNLHNYFGSVTTSIFTLFMCITGGVSWEIVQQPLREVHWFYIILFVIY